MRFSSQHMAVVIEQLFRGSLWPCIVKHGCDLRVHRACFGEEMAKSSSTKALVGSGKCNNH